MRFRRTSQPAASPYASLMSSRPDPLAAAVEALTASPGSAGKRAPELASAGPGGAPFPHAQRDEPLPALKAAYVRVAGDRIAFTSLTCHNGGTPVPYGAQDEAACYCGNGGYYGAYAISVLMGAAATAPVSHPRPGRDTSCGFYAWKPGEPVPWQEKAWLLEVDLYGRVIEHERGYRAQKQRVLRISPFVPVLCEPPFRLVARDGNITVACGGCPARDEDHPVTADRIRKYLNVEIDMERAWRMRENGDPDA